MGEIDEKHTYHHFRKYSEYMRDWIFFLKEGECAFDNLLPHQRPHRIIKGKYVANKMKCKGKYTRTYWNKVGLCIHTRNDWLGRQNTIHPVDDRGFSISELILMKTIPDSF